jgi:TRAP-type C4-dicarboxylate transport system substrate-binding protein
MRQRHGRLDQILALQSFTRHRQTADHQAVPARHRLGVGRQVPLVACSQQALAAKINKRGKGVLEIEVLPFNSIKMFQQPPAVSKGRIDLACTPAAFYARAIPENEAVSTASSVPEQVRSNGGTKMIDELQQKHFNVKYLGWTTGGDRFRIYMKNAPKFNAAGLPDFTGVKMRDNPIYGAFLKALNATTHNLPSSAVFSALEKGVVEASAWATNGLKGLKWDKFLRHAVDADFYRTDIGLIMNLDKWKGLSAKARGILQDTVIEQEAVNTALLQKLSASEEASLKKEGMKFHAAPDKAGYLKLAVDSAYARMMERLNKAKRGTGHVSKLRAAYQQYQRNAKVGGGPTTAFVPGDTPEAGAAGRIGDYFLNSFIVVLPSLALILILSAMTAYVLARFPFPGNRFIFYLFLYYRM